MTDRHDQLIQAIIKDDAFRVTALLQEEPGLATTRDSEGRTPLLLALYFRKEDLARLIQERTEGLDVFEAAALGETDALGRELEENPEAANQVAPDGFSLLGLAAYFGRAEAVRILLGAGADPNRPAENQTRVCPIHSAAANRDAQASVELCTLLLEGGADPNRAQAGGWTPLHQAAAHGRKELVEALLAHGADVAALSEDNRTPAQMAEVKGHTAIQDLLTKG